MSDDLRGLAEAAYPKPRGLCDDWFAPGCPDLAHLRQQEQDFIAAANPTAVLALLDRLEAAEAAVAYHDDWRYCPRCGRPHDWAGELSPGAPCMVCGRYPANRATLDAD